MGKGLFSWVDDIKTMTKPRWKRVGRIKDEALHKTKPLTYTPVRSKPKGKKKR